MTEQKALVIWFEKLRKEDVPIVGGKNASLGEMISASMPVPPGFAITAFAYEKFIEETRIAEKIYEIIKATVTDICCMAVTTVSIASTSTLPRHSGCTRTIVSR